MLKGGRIKGAVERVAGWLVGGWMDGWVGNVSVLL